MMTKLPRLKWTLREPAAIVAEVAEPLPKSAPELRAAGDAARDSRSWAAAAAAYGHYLRLVPEDGGIWTQHGHMLKEVGLLGLAGDSYDRAIGLLPEDADLRVQRAILYKFEGNFADAVRLFREAAELGYPDRGFLDTEVGFINRTENRRAFGTLIFGRSVSPFRIYLSSAVGTPPAETSKDLDTFLGSTNYSYAFSLKGYLLGLDAMGLPYDVITSPEYLPSIRDRSSSAVNLHFAFYPPDAPRMLKGAYNIFVMAWEFERLRRPQEQSSHHAFNDPVKMLRRGDEVWMVSEFGADAIRASGVETVFTVPSPVISSVLESPRRELPTPEAMFRNASRLEHIEWLPLAIAPGLQSTASQHAKSRRSSLRRLLVEQLDEQKPVFFLTVLNIYDYRKQLKPVLDAFVRLAKVRPAAFLLLKVSFVHHATGDLNEFMLRHQVNDPGEMAPPLVSDRIWLTADAFSRDDLNTLYDVSAFYVSSSHGEGQNLPLIEAMGRGVVPVSVDHTAMRDYISAEDAIVIPSTVGPLSLRLRERYGMHDLNTYYVSARDAYRALDTAAGMSDDAYARLSRAALSVVKDKFGIAPFQVSVEQGIRRASDRLRTGS